MSLHAFGENVVEKLIVIVGARFVVSSFSFLSNTMRNNLIQPIAEQISNNKITPDGQIEARISYWCMRYEH